jgi:hypothetical protein
MLAVLAVATLVAGCAAQADVAGGDAVGRVTGVYVERYPGVFVERAALSDAAGKPMWARVAFASALQDGRSSTTALLEPGTLVETGDVVEVRLSQAGWHTAEGAQNYTRVTALLAKRNSELALNFGERPPTSSHR